MKYLFKISIISAILFSCQQDEIFTEEFYQCKNAPLENNTNHPKAEIYQNLISEIVESGVPGMMLTVHDDQHGYWSGASGTADLASAISLRPCHQTRVGSTVKTFTAVSALLLQQDGLLDIDDPVTDYITPEDIRGLANAEKSTIRQLLQHSSGIYNYIQSPQFQTASLNDLIKVWTPDELLSYARDKEPYFEPGTDVLYSNTNYILLGMIIEEITGKPFYEFFRTRIFEPVGLNYTQFAATDPVPDGIIRGYVDLYSNLNLINATYYSGWDYFTADGGLISNTYDLNVFMTKLFTGQILSEDSMKEFLSFKDPKDQDENGYQTSYGLGIFKIITPHGPAYLHSGDAIGYYASMVYFPNQNVSISWAVNANYGKIDQFTQSKAAMDKIFARILEE